jgi:hypothetical protein
MNELSLAEQEALYDEFIESQREELRKEGAEELRIEILRALKLESFKAFSAQHRLGIDTAMIVVEKATR